MAKSNLDAVMKMLADNAKKRVKESCEKAAKRVGVTDDDSIQKRIEQHRRGFFDAYEPQMYKRTGMLDDEYAGDVKTRYRTYTDGDSVGIKIYYNPSEFGYKNSQINHCGLNNNQILDYLFNGEDGSGTVEYKGVPPRSALWSGWKRIPTRTIKQRVKKILKEDGWVVK